MSKRNPWRLTPRGEMVAEMLTMLIGITAFYIGVIFFFG